SDIEAVRSGEVITIQLVNPFRIEGLEELCSPILEEIEQKIYGSYAIVDKVYVYRSPVSRRAPAASWLWHFDNHPHEVLKVMIYLTNVTEGRAPFEYLRDARTLEPLRGAPLAPSYGTSRISDEAIARHVRAGCQPQRVTGKAGTLLIFDENVVHR